MVAGRHLSVAVLAAVALFALPAAAPAATYTVTRTDDPPTYAGLCSASDCSLRAAVQSANLSDGNTIVIPPGTYTVNTGGSGSSGELVLSKAMTITGDSARTTIITATGGGRLFTVSANVAMSGVTLTGGIANSDGGGAILISGSGARLDLDASTLRGNKASGTTSSAGGAINNNGGTLNVTKSTFNSNRAGESSLPPANGGAIATTGPTTLTNVTISGNVANGGMANGGGVSTAGATPPVAVVNSTIAGNGTVATLSGAGGNLDLGSNASVLNTIVTAGTGSAGSENCARPVASQGHNIDSLDQCGFHASGDKPLTDPQIGPLQDNVGPTDTRAIGAGSPAVDAGAAQGCPVTDQRGLPRPQGNGCDIGAFEFLPPRKPGEAPSTLVINPATGRIVDTFAGAKLKSRRIAVKGKYAIVVQTCPAGTPGYCLVNDTLFAKKAKIGSTTVKMKPGKTQSVKVKLSKAALQKIKRKHKLKSTLVMLSRDSVFTAKAKATPVTLVQKKKKKRKR